MRHSLLAGIAGLALLTLSAGAALAADVKIQTFFGHWRGDGMLENDFNLAQPMAARDINVVIEAGPTPGGFTVSWTTVTQPGNATDKTGPTRRQASLAFSPTAEPSVFKADQATDPTSENGYAFARVTGQTLRINVFHVNAKGIWDMQTYDRKLAGTGMDMSFVARKDGEKTRTARGRLVKDAR